MAKFDLYADMLIDWQSRMNLVGPSTLLDIWGRHFADSAQLSALGAERSGAWLDLGSGAGFPGLVVSLLGAPNVHLVESTAKKCRFLEAVRDALNLQGVTIHNKRVEALPPFAVDVISARALANLGQLFEWGLRFATPKTLWLLPRGEAASDEIAAARLKYNFDVDLVPGRSDPRGKIVIAGRVRKKAV